MADKRHELVCVFDAFRLLTAALCVGQTSFFKKLVKANSFWKCSVPQS